MLYKLFTLLILLLSAPAWGATYYMRADGTAANKAAATSCGAASSAMSIATHNSETFAAGDTITLCDSGGVFKTTIQPPTAGSSDSERVTYNNSGSPVVTSSTTATGWAGGPVYTISEADTVYVLYEDAVPLQKATSNALSDGYWYYAGETLYYKPTAGSPGDHTVIYNTPTISPGFYIVAKPYITVTGIEFKNNYYGIYISNVSTGVTISSCRFISNLQGIIHWTTGNVAGSTVTDNYFYRCSLGVNYSVTSGTTTFSSGTITGNNLVDIGTVNGTVTWATILRAALDLESISGQNLSSYTISGNTITGGNNYPIYIYSINDVICDGNTIGPGNKITTNAATYGITLSGDGDGGHINSKIIYNVLVDAGTYAIALRNGADANAQNIIAHNTLYGGTTGFKIQNPTASSNYWTIKNNLVYGNTGYNAYLDPAYEATIIFDYNLYGATTGDVFGTSGADENYTEWQAHGLDAHTVVGNPLLTSDYKLTAASPAKDAGAAITGLHSGSNIIGGDAAGNTWLYGDGVDIGAYEIWQGHFQSFFEFFQAFPKIYTVP